MCPAAEIQFVAHPWPSGRVAEGKGTTRKKRENKNRPEKTANVKKVQMYNWPRTMDQGAKEQKSQKAKGARSQDPSRNESM